MPKIISPYHESLIHKFSGWVSSSRQISKMLLKQGIKINHGTVSNVLKWKGMKRQCDLEGIEFKRQIKISKLTPKVLKNI